MSRRTIVSLLLSSAGIVLILGCNNQEAASVHGDVTVDGKPLEKGVITFTGPDGKSSKANIENGKYDLRTTPGSNRVQISAPVATGKRKEYNGPNAPLVEITEESLPAKYHTKSELTFDVKAGSNTKDWAVEGNKSRKP